MKSTVKWFNHLSHCETRTVLCICICDDVWKMLNSPIQMETLHSNKLLQIQLYFSFNNKGVKTPFKWKTNRKTMNMLLFRSCIVLTRITNPLIQRQLNDLFQTN